MNAWIHTKFLGIIILNEEEMWGHYYRRNPTINYITVQKHCNSEKKSEYQSLEFKDVKRP